MHIWYSSIWSCGAGVSSWLNFYQGNPLNLLRSCLFVCFHFFMLLFPNPWQDVQWGNLRRRSFSVMKKREFLSGEMNSIPWLRGILWHNWTSAEVSSKAPTRPGWWVDASVEWNMFTIAHDLLGKTIVSCRCFLRHKPCDFGSLTLLASTSSVCPLSQP